MPIPDATFRAPDVSLSGGGLPAVSNILTGRALYEPRIEVEPFDKVRPTTLREMMIISKISMNEMNRHHQCIPTDTIERTTDLATRKGGHLFTLRCRVSDKHGGFHDELLGGGIAIEGLENFRNEIPHLPSELLQFPKAWRVIRLFMTPLGRDLTDKQGFKMIIDAMKARAGDQPIIAMKLREITHISGTPQDPAGKAVWLHAGMALTAQEFIDLGGTFVEPFPGPERTVGGVFGWCVWSKDLVARSPVSEAAARLTQVQSDKFASMMAASQVMPASGGRVAVFSTAKFAYEMANVWRNNAIVCRNYPGAGETKPFEKELPNLWTSPADPKTCPLPDGEADALVIQGVLPDIAKNGDRELLREFIRTQARQLKEGGALSLRDTMLADGPDRVVVNFEDRGNGSASSTAKRFAEFISSPHRESHITAEEWGKITSIPHESSDGVKSYDTPLRPLNEFLLKYFYPNLTEERERCFTLFRPRDVIEILESEGFRVLHAGPEHNAYIHDKHHRGKAIIFGPDGKVIEPFPTNYVFLAEKVAPEDGVRIKPLPFSVERTENPSYLRRQLFEPIDIQSGKSLGPPRAIVSRPGFSAGAIAYAIDRDQAFMSIRDYPRPNRLIGDPPLDGSSFNGYQWEQPGEVASKECITSQEVREKVSSSILERRAGLNPSHIKAFDPPQFYLSRADSTDESVSLQTVEMSSLPTVTFVDGGVTDLESRVKVRTVEARRLIQTDAVNADIERAAYYILRRHGLNPGSWRGDKIQLANQDLSRLPISSITDILSPPPHARYEERPEAQSDFLEIWKGSYGELNARGEFVDHRPFVRECVLPGKSRNGEEFSTNSVPVAAVMKGAIGDGPATIYLGVEVKDMNAAEKHTASSLLASPPTFRLLKKIGPADAKPDVTQRLDGRFGVKINAIESLGNKHGVGFGISPELMQPMAAEVNAADSNLETLKWAPLQEYVNNLDLIKCGVLRTVVLRLAHAYGLLDPKK